MPVTPTIIINVGLNPNNLAATKNQQTKYTPENFPVFHVANTGNVIFQAADFPFNLVPGRTQIGANIIFFHSHAR
jgi:hypothetical protein